MKTLTLIFCLFSLSAFGQESLKTIVTDRGDKGRDTVDHAKLCGLVVADQQRLLKAIRPEFKQKVVLKESAPLEVFRADNSLGYAAKCVLSFPLK